MRVHFSSQGTIVARCGVLLAALAPALASCGGAGGPGSCSGPVCGEPAPVIPASALTVAGDVLYGKSTRTVFALRARTGAVLWQVAGEDVYASANPLLAPPVVDGQTVVVSWGTGLVQAWRASDGRSLWRSQPLAGLTALSSYTPEPLPVVAAGAVYAAAEYGTIAAWDEGDGHTLWLSRFNRDAAAEQQLDGGAVVLPQPVVVGSTVYASAGRSVYALRAADGAVVWRWQFPLTPLTALATTPVVAGNTVYVQGSDGTVIALDAATGALRWRSPENPRGETSPPLPSMVVQGQQVYVSHLLDTVRALNAATGAELRRFVTGDTPASPVPASPEPLTPPAVAGGGVYVSSGSVLYALDSATGHLVWRTPVPPAIDPKYSVLAHAPIAIPEHDVVIVVGRQGVQAWRSTDGSAVWTLPYPSVNQGDQRLLYCAVAAGTVYLSRSADEEAVACYSSDNLPPVQALRAADGKRLWQAAV